MTSGLTSACVQALQLQRSLDDTEQWLGSVERKLLSDDCGSDLQCVNRLLKCLQSLEEEVDEHRDRIQVNQHWTYRRHHTPSLAVSR